MISSTFGLSWHSHLRMLRHISLPIVHLMISSLAALVCITPPLQAADKLDTNDALIALKLTTPTPFGYTIGDTVVHNAQITVRSPFVLENGSLPKPGAINHWLELKNLTINQANESTQTRLNIEFEYQLFRGVRAFEKLTIPPRQLRFRTPKNHAIVEIPAWEFSYGPLIPPAVDDAAIEARPPQAPQPISMTRQVRWLVALLAGGFASAVYLAWWFGVLPFMSRKNGPFAHAYTAIKLAATNRTPPNESCRQAFQAFHRALDDTAGKTVFVEQLDTFYQASPQYQEFRDEIENFFTRSRHYFYCAGDINSADTVNWLLALASKHREVER